MSEAPKLGSLQEILDHAQLHADDFESLKIALPPRVWFSTPSEGVFGTSDTVGGLVTFVGGTSVYLSVEDTEALLNEGSLQRFRIPIKLAKQT